jgi:phage terminase large subunit-like protein
LRAAFGLKLDAKQREIFAAISGGRAPPTKRVRELWAMVGRKGGKSKIAAAIAVFQALFVKHKLSRGEKGVVLVLAMSMDQAKVVFDYCVGFLTASKHLQQEIRSMTTSEIRLRNGITIATHANSFRSVRGRTLCCCIFDEVAFWRDDTSAQPDKET